MARTVQECYDYIVANVATSFSAVGITLNTTTWSNRNILRLICWSIATAQSLGEQLLDIYYDKLETSRKLSAPATSQWIQQAVFEFQYSATTPQYLTVVAGVAYYAIVNTAFRIVTACAVQSTVTNVVNIKVAKGSPLGALSGPELSALSSYIQQKGAAGITYNVTSTSPDLFYIEATVYYVGSYSAVISTSVISTLDSYLVNLSNTRFGGDILMSDLELLVKGIDGVNDVIFERVSARYSTQSLFSGIDLVLAGDWVNRKYTFGAGYSKQETTGGYTFADKLTFIAE